MKNFNSEGGLDKADSSNNNVYGEINDEISNGAFEGEDNDAGNMATTVHDDFTNRKNLSRPNARHETLSKEAIKGGASSEATSSQFFFGNGGGAETFSDRATKNIKIYASEVSEKISEKYLEIETRLKAYIGTIDEAEEHTVDN